MSGTVRWPARAGFDDGPLAGVRVLDLSALATGPWGAMLLATLGADVVKVDPPDGDHIRLILPTKKGDPTTYTICNLGKRNIVLDLKSAEGKAACLRLAELADVIVENHRPGAMTRLGLDFESVSQVNPGIIYCSSSSFGNEGPMALVGSTDPHGQAFSGFVSMNGAYGADPEFLRYGGVVDLSTAACLAQACLIGLHWRTRNGRGCHITTSQFEGAMSLQISRSSDYLVARQDVVPLGTATSAYAPSEAFECRDHRYVNVSAPNQRIWEALCEAIARPDLLEMPEFRTNHDRVANRSKLSAILAGEFAAYDLVRWRYRLNRYGVPHGEYIVLDDVVAGMSQAEIGRYITSVPHLPGGELKVGAPPWKFSRSKAESAVSARAGQHQSQFTDLPLPADQTSEESR